MASIKVNVKGFRRISNKIQHRLNRFGKEQEYIFAKPLSRTLLNIKKRLKYDTKVKYGHIYTGKMYNSVGYRFTKISIQEYEVKFGLFVPYGMVFEVGGKPRNVPLSRLKPWARKKLGDENLAYPVKSKIRKRGSKGYGIVERTWSGNQNYYLKIVHRRFWDVWAK